MQKKILIINTGGTISCTSSSKGYIPQKGIVEHTLQTMPELQHPEMPKYEMYEFPQLIDSSNITLNDWNSLATIIQEHYQDIDGFVILHGTDTMAYTASALSFMLENLNKSVIFTGAQIPLQELRSDGQHNIATALYLAQSTLLNEVCIYFNQMLFRGNRTQKVSAYEFAAFDSPNLFPLAKVGTNIEWDTTALLPPQPKPFHAQLLQQHFIANFRLFPSFSTEVLKHILQQPIRGLILETYGSGNAQDNDPVFLDIIGDACQKGIIIVNCSQCQHGMVNMSTYATGSKLQDLGVISGFNMTPEAAHCKLLYLLSKYKDVQTIKEQLVTSIRGELDY